jgi:hypothetical protein
MRMLGTPVKASRTQDSQDSLVTWAHAHLSPHFAPNFCPHFAPKTSEKGKSGTSFFEHMLAVSITANLSRDTYWAFLFRKDKYKNSFYHIRV